MRAAEDLNVFATGARARNIIRVSRSDDRWSVEQSVLAFPLVAPDRNGALIRREPTKGPTGGVPIRKHNRTP